MYSTLFASPTGPRYLAWLTLALTLGIYLGLSLPSGTDFILLFSILLGLLIGLLLSGILAFLLEKSIRKHLVSALFLWFLLFSFSFGILRVCLFDLIQSRDLKETAGTPHTYTAIVTGNPTLSNSGKSYGFPVKVLSAESMDGTRKDVTGQVKLYAPPEISKTLLIGDAVSFTATLHHPDNARFPGGFELKSYLYRQNLLFQQYTKTITKTQVDYQPGFLDHLNSLGTKARQGILDSIDQGFEKASEEGALLKGILLGVNTDFTEEQYQDFVDSGLIHITSVSGMHVVFLSSFLLALFRRLVPNSIAQLILIPFLILFAAIASFTPSVSRSTIMMILFALAQIIRRESDSLTSLSISAAILLIINPYTLTSYSFILSFSSTLGIILFTPPFFRYLMMPFQKGEERRIARRKPKSPLRRYLLEPVSSSLALSGGSLLGMGFFGMRFFRRITLGGFPANLCLLPFSAATFVLGIINWPISVLCPALGTFLARFPLGYMLKCINWVARIFSHPIFHIETPTPPVSAFLPYLVFCIAIYFTLKENPKNNT